MTALVLPGAPPVPRPRVKFLQQKLVLPFTLPDLNELLSARGRRLGNTNAYAHWKQRMQPAVAGLAIKAKLRPLEPGRGAWLTFRWFERDEKRDPLDLPAARKMIVDALCGHSYADDRQARAGVLHCDGWHCIAGGTDHFAVDRENPRIEVTIYGEARRG